MRTSALVALATVVLTGVIVTSPVAANQSHSCLAWLSEAQLARVAQGGSLLTTDEGNRDVQGVTSVWGLDALRHSWWFCAWAFATQPDSSGDRTGVGLNLAVIGYPTQTTAAAQYRTTLARWTRPSICRTASGIATASLYCQRRKGSDLYVLSGRTIFVLSADEEAANVNTHKTHFTPKAWLPILEPLARTVVTRVPH
jgi:hypothetical protein